VVDDRYRYVVIVFPDWGDVDGSVLVTNACGKELKPVLYAWSQKDSFMSYERTQRWSPDGAAVTPRESSSDLLESLSIEIGFCD
jgi:hypothetical protein